ncbi:MAG TPA: hypothetical protein VGV59_04590 [Pyrinomonadaceae bacterium]|nr:hypothetical protein [Pyrinomonadaceae bacterium]
MADEKPTEQTEFSNRISEETGQFDARFILWRLFCSENNVPVETLPSELEGETREKWEKLKDRELHKPAEQADS